MHVKSPGGVAVQGHPGNPGLAVFVITGREIMLRFSTCGIFATALLCGALTVAVVAQGVPDKPHDVVVLEPKAQLPETTTTAQIPAVVPDRPLAPLEPKGKRIYHGVCINAENAEDFPRRIQKYSEIVGHRPSVCVQFAHAYSGDGKQWGREYYADLIKTIDKEGAIPFLKATTKTYNNAKLFFKVNDILAGKHDDHFIMLAKVCKEYGKPIFISWNHEMNGDWYSYSEPFAKKHPELKSDWTAEKYKEFHRYVWKIFKEHGGDKVAFTFAACLVGRKYGDWDERQSWKAYYPGDAYVDWLAPSYYNEIDPATFDVLASETNKPIFPSEWGSTPVRYKWYSPKPYPGDRVWMSRTMNSWMHRYPNLKGSGYYQWEHSYAIQRDPGQLEVYKKALNDPMFIHGDPRPAAAGAD